MDVIPLDATLVKGSHGSICVDKSYYPVIITDKEIKKDEILATDIYDIIWQHISSL